MALAARDDAADQLYAFQSWIPPRFIGDHAFGHLVAAIELAQQLAVQLRLDLGGWCRRRVLIHRSLRIASPHLAHGAPADYVPSRHLEQALHAQDRSLKRLLLG